MVKRKHRGGGSDRHSPRPGSTGPRSKSAPFGGGSGDGKPRFGKPSSGRSGSDKSSRGERPKETQRAWSPDGRPKTAKPIAGGLRDGGSRPGRPADGPRRSSESTAKPRPPRRQGAARPAALAEPQYDAPAEGQNRRQTHGGARQIWLYGLHAVRAALANPRRRRRRLVLSEEAAVTLRDSLDERAGGTGGEGPAEVMPRDSIARLLPPGAVHQGAALLTEPLSDIALEDVLDAAAEAETALVLVLDQVTDPQNVGAILRSAAAFGAAAVIVPDRHAPPETGALVKAASGAVEVVPLVRVVNLARALEQLKEAGFWCAGLEGGAPQTLAAADLSGKVALVLGAEGEGLRRLTRDHCDILVRLPISERIESLNVSAAAAVALYELARKA